MTTASHPPPPTPRTWHPAIFSCFQEWRQTLKESVFRVLRRRGKKRRRHWRLSLWKSSRTVLNYGKKRWDKCIDSQGEYFEGDKILGMFREIYDLKKNSRYFWVPSRTILIAFPLQQWRRECTILLRYTYIRCLSVIWKVNTWVMVSDRYDEGLRVEGITSLGSSKHANRTEQNRIRGCWHAVVTVTW